MDGQKVDMFLMMNAKYFEYHQIGYIKRKLTDLDENSWELVQTLDLKDPTLCLILSILCGSIGVDRFIVGDVGLGILKLFTCGGFGIWTLVDWFLIMGVAKEKNLQNFKRVT